MDNKIAKLETAAKVESCLKIISNLNIKPQTKLKILSVYLPSQISFNLRIYSFSPTWISEAIDSVCVKYVRAWIEAPVSSCIEEWLVTPVKKCGLGIASFRIRSENLTLSKQNALMKSKNNCIRELWQESNRFNVSSDSLLCDNVSFKSVLKHQREQQYSKASDHFLGLKTQGVIAKSISEYIPPGQIKHWNSVIEKQSGYIFNFTRKAVQSQLPTLLNVFRWNRAPSNLCPRCGLIQSNKHVLSNCGAPEALARYTERHNRILMLLIDWIRPKLNPDVEIFCDLQLAGTRHVSELFNHFKPDLALKNSKKVGLLELTVCHETNFMASRNYKLNKYGNIACDRSSLIKDVAISLSTCEVSTLGFVALEPKFLADWTLPPLDNECLKSIIKSAVVSSFEIYAKRNI